MWQIGEASLGIEVLLLRTVKEATAPREMAETVAAASPSLAPLHLAQRFLEPSGQQVMCQHQILGGKA